MSYKQRLAAAKRAIAKERASWGMLADQLGTKETPEERVARLDRQGAAWVKGWNDDLRKQWLQVGKMLRRRPDRAEFIRFYKMIGYPNSPEYWLDTMKRTGYLSCLPQEIIKGVIPWRLKKGVIIQ